MTILAGMLDECARAVWMYFCSTHVSDTERAREIHVTLVGLLSMC
jgi:hypothetical protein